MTLFYYIQPVYFIVYYFKIRFSNIIFTLYKENVTEKRYCVISHVNITCKSLFLFYIKKVIINRGPKSQAILDDQMLLFLFCTVNSKQ